MSSITLLALASLIYSFLRTQQGHAWPSFNNGPSCTSCHASGANIEVQYIGEHKVRIEVLDAPSEVGGEIIKDDIVIDELDSGDNPFVLEVSEDGTYTVNAGLDNFGRVGTATVEVVQTKVNTLSWGYVKKIFR
jgi:hypothetical protein